MSIPASLEFKPLRQSAGLTFLVAFLLSSPVGANENPYAEPAEPGLPPSTMELDLSRTAIVITDPQIDFLSPKGVTWGLVGNSVTENKTFEHIEQLLKAAKQHGNARVVPTASA